MKRFLLIAFSAALLLLFATFAGAFFLLDEALTPGHEHTHMPAWRLGKVVKNNPWMRSWADSILLSGTIRDTFVTMQGGERHHALLLPAHESTSKKVALLVHGYLDNGMGMMHIAAIYHQMGYHVMLPDLHAHGQSQGQGIQMGWKERPDIRRWMAIADSLWRGNAPQTAMVLHGVSMGAALVMGLSGQELAPYVKCIVEDCGYTSVWDELAHELKARYDLPPFPLLYAASMLCKWRYGWSFQEASPARMVAKSRLPMLFIHGDKDTFVPFSMVKTLYRQKPYPKELWVTRGVTHAKSCQSYPRKYRKKVAAFVAKW